MKLKKLITAVLIALCSFSAKADLFDFSYKFASGDIVAGSLEGTQNGIFVENISNVSVLWNGNQFAGPLNQFYYNSGCCFSSGPAIVSFDANFNSFAFSDGTATNLFDATNFFAMMADNGPWDSAVVKIGDNYSSDVSYNGAQYISPEIQGPFDASNWTLTPVPEPEIYAMMGLGLGLLGWVGRRRKLQAA